MWQIFLNFGRILGYRKAHDFSRFNINICDDDDDDIYLYMAILLNPAQEKRWLEVSRGRSIYEICLCCMLFDWREECIICRLSCRLFAAFFCVFFTHLIPLCPTRLGSTALETVFPCVLLCKCFASYVCVVLFCFFFPPMTLHLYS
jgi:hypothetical protein